MMHVNTMKLTNYFNFIQLDRHAVDKLACNKQCMRYMSGCVHPTLSTVFVVRRPTLSIAMTHVRSRANSPILPALVSWKCFRLTTNKSSTEDAGLRVTTLKYVSTSRITRLRSGSLQHNYI